MTSEQYRKAQKVIHHYVNYEDMVVIGGIAPAAYMLRNAR